MGFTRRIATGVWMGFPEGGRTMEHVRGIAVTGGSFPARIWKAYMEKAVQGTRVEGFGSPSFEGTILNGSPSPTPSGTPTGPLPSPLQSVPATLPPSPKPSHSPNPNPSPSPSPTAQGTGG